jgi:mannose-6-phosphate isomerase-like protein (cupin superfamily)
MRIIWMAVVAACVSAASRAEIHDVLKSDEIDARLAADKPPVLHERSNFAISLGAQTGQGAPETHSSADEVLFIRNGSGEVSIGSHRYEADAGDVIHIRRGVEHRINAPAGRLGYVAIRIFPTGEGPAASGARPAARIMPDVLRASEIAETFAKFDANQPIHSAPNFTMNYVIYSGHAGPWEAHRGCVDIYFLKIGTANAELGGQIRNAKEESPGEIRGDGVTGSRHYSVGPGDIVLIPRETAHHMNPTSAKLGYVLLKVWAE